MVGVSIQLRIYLHKANVTTVQGEQLILKNSVIINITKGVIRAVNNSSDATNSKHYMTAFQTIQRVTYTE